MNEFESGYMAAATTLCMLGHTVAAAEMLRESGIQFNVEELDEVDKPYIKELIESEGGRLAGCIA